MKHWGKPKPKESKLPHTVGCAVFPQEHDEMFRQKNALKKHEDLPKMPVSK